jgi:hypothetical protein
MILNGVNCSEGYISVTITENNQTRYFDMPKNFTTEDLSYVMNEFGSPSEAVDMLENATPEELERIQLLARMHDIR